MFWFWLIGADLTEASEHDSHWVSVLSSSHAFVSTNLSDFLPVGFFQACLLLVNKNDFFTARVLWTRGISSLSILQQLSSSELRRKGLLIAPFHRPYAPSITAVGRITSRITKRKLHGETDQCPNISHRHRDFKDVPKFLYNVEFV